MSILTPDYDLVADIEKIVDEVNDDYSNYLKHNDDYDNIDFLAELLNEKSVDVDMDIEWKARDDIRENKGEWISAAAERTLNANYLIVYLWSDNLEGSWGPKTFKEIILGMLCHETIHFEQFERIDPIKFLFLESGHQKGIKLKAKTGKERDWHRLYLRDPHELMAYGHDLSEDIKRTSNPAAALRNPEAFIDELPVYGMFRNIWPSDAKPMKKLLSYTARYMYEKYN